MIVLSAFRDFADGLTRGFSLFFTERRELHHARTAQQPRQPKKSR